MYIPISGRAINSSGEFHDSSLTPGELAGLAICMLLIFAGLIGFLFLLVRHCSNNKGTRLWRRSSRPHTREDIGRDGSQSTAEKHGMTGVELVQPPAKAHVSSFTKRDNKDDVDETLSPTVEETYV